MLVSNVFKPIKCLNAINLRKYLSSMIDKKPTFSIQDEIGFKMNCNLNHKEKFDECLKHGITSNTVLSNKWIFNINLNHLSNGLTLLKKWNPKKMDDLFVLLQMPMKKLVFLTKKTQLESQIVPRGNRVYYFASTFEKNPQEVCYHLIHYKFLFTRNFATLNHIYHILIENNVDKNDIWKDTWIFMYSIEQISQRISLTKTANLPIKPWMLRCKPEVFERTIEIKQENRVVLNKDSTAQYLAKRLKVPEKTISYISSKYPTTLRVSPIKLKEILDFLLKEGFKPTHILSTPRVFTHSISTLQERLTELRDLGAEPTLTALCKNKTTYQELVNKLILKNTKIYI
ncbi:transcription termination factor, mitochondrial [Melanaphis sacchari]|uniref:transcription termination factor, mitochondrial n=1 Tax=Melanaphis sacchari TaxID=742174 RepID=UPI000DC14924|nr:transcription termination factor, mitochondrial [Melanaphis sacchari]